MQNEEWRVIDDCPLYEISNLGRVRRTNYLAYYIDSNGYPAVQLFDGHQKKKARRIHQLVAKAFLPNPDNLPEVNHKTGDKLKFTAEDLEWCGRIHNMRHAHESGLIQNARGVHNGNSRLTEDQVRAIRALLGKMSQRQIAKLFGVSQFAISTIARGLTWAHIPQNPEAVRIESPFPVLRGERNPKTKLTETQVLEIRALWAERKLSEKEIGQKFGVSMSAINNIVRRKNWTHI